MEAREMETLSYRLGDLGYSMLGRERSIDVASLIEDIVRSGEHRYLKSVPFIVERAGMEGSVDDVRAELDVEDFLGPGPDDMQRLMRFLLLTVSYTVMEGTEESAGWRGRLRTALTRAYETGLGSIKTLTPPSHPVVEGYLRFRGRSKSAPTFPSLVEAVRKWFPQVDEYRDEYLMQRRIRSLEERRTMEERRRLENERRTNLALARLFPRKQREVVRKVVMHEPLSKSEYEYYIRVVKKKLKAIRTLAELASDALTVRPVRMTGCPWKNDI